MTLYITEKSSQNKPLKAALEKNNIKNYKIESLSGHIMELKNPLEYEGGLTKEWVKDIEENRVPFIPKYFKKKVKKGKYDMYKKVVKSAKEAEKIILASDPDNEGVTLVMEILDENMLEDKVIGMVNMSKLDINSLSKAVNVIDKIPYKKMYEAGEARAKSDWIFGMNGTVAATVYLGKLLGGTVHVGGVKLPILNMVVNRDLNFENFKEIPFFTIKGKYSDGEKAISIKFKYDGNDHFETEEEAEKILKQLNNGTVKTYKEDIKKTEPPKPFSLTDLQSECSKRFNYTASNTLKYAQSLYDNEFQSYPRTDSNYYAVGDFENAKDILNNLSRYKNYKEIIKKIPENLTIKSCYNDSKIVAHTALSPTQNYPELKDKNEENVYKVVSERFIIQFLEPYKYIKRSIFGETNVDKLTFEATTSQTKSLGFKELDIIINGKKDETEENKMPEIKEGQLINFTDLTIEKGFSKPKPRFTESSLLLSLERVFRYIEDEDVDKNLKDVGIGTPATRGAILEELFKKDYLKLDNKKKVVSTQKARELIKILPEELTNPILRAKLETKINGIIEGNFAQEDVINFMGQMLNEGINAIKEYVNKNGIEIKRPSKIEDSGIRCPLCSGKVLEAEKYFKCENTGKFNMNKKEWEGKCQFSFIKENKLIKKTFDRDMLAKFINNEAIEFDRGLLKFDKNSKFFSSVEWKNEENLDFHKFEFESKGKKYSGFKDSCSSENIKERKMFFMPFLGKVFTEDEAKKLFNGETISVTNLKGKKKSFDANLKLIKKDSGWSFDMSF